MAPHLWLLTTALAVCADPVVAASKADVPGVGQAASSPAVMIQDRWAFHPPAEGNKPLLDLRFLNEKEAGQSGFVTVDEQGDFRLGNGQPVRFWAINSTVGREKPFVPRPRWKNPEPDLDRHARFLARLGVNMVRLHASINPDPKQNGRLTDINEKERDWIWRAVAAYKRHGIYTTISPYFVLTARVGKDWGVPAKPDAPPFGLLFFDETLQRGYRAWLKALFSETNPYTRLPLARDPAVAIIQLQNEDSLLFWTVGSIQGEAGKQLAQRYAAWLRKKYGSLDKALSAWKGSKLPGDDLAAGVVALAGIWEMTQERKGGLASRLADQLQFWAETMYEFNAKMIRYLREELQCKSVVNPGNWKTASPARLNDVERWSYTPGEVLATNHYFGGLHRGKNSSWAVANGHEFTRLSALLHPEKLPTNLRQIAGKAMLVTESGWVMPNGYAAEGPFLVAAYQSLLGLDGFYWFSTASETWEPPQSANGYLPSQAKWPIATPDTMGQFPACALLYRKGYVRKGQPALVEERRLEDLWQRRLPLVAEEASFDPNRDTEAVAPGSPIKQRLSGQVFLVGPVEVRLGGDPARSRLADLDRYIDRKNQVVRSITSEIMLDHGKGVCVVDAPCAQGAVAFFEKQPTIRTRDLHIQCKTTHAAVLAVSMDGKPLASSGRILVQVGTECRPTGWKETPISLMVGKNTVAGFRLEDIGRDPWQLVKADLELTLANPSVRRATVLNGAGLANGTVALQRKGSTVRFKFPPDALYVLLEE
jgi:hypothetical protein